MRILCVDDDGLVLAVTADLIRALGHDVVEAIGGDNGARAIDGDGPFDLLVTDVHMPGSLGGHDLADRARVDWPEMPVIYFSGIDQVAQKRSGDRVLRKPCTLGELQQAIDGSAAAIRPATPI